METFHCKFLFNGYLSSCDLSSESGDPLKTESEYGDDTDFLIPVEILDVGFETEIESLNFF